MKSKMGSKKVYKKVKKVVVRCVLFVLGGLFNPVGATMLQDVPIIISQATSLHQQQEEHSSKQEESWKKRAEESVVSLWRSMHVLLGQTLLLLEKTPPTDTSTEKVHNVASLRSTSSIASVPYEIFFPELSGSRYFRDIEGDVNKNAIETLARNRIVDVSRELFYPHNHVRRYDFIIMLMNTLRVSGKFSGSTVQHDVVHQRIVDVSQDASYANNVYAAYNAGLLDYLLVLKRGESYLYPDQHLTKHEALHILNTIYPGEIIYDVELADQSMITRSELAGLLVTLMPLP